MNSFIQLKEGCLWFKLHTLKTIIGDTYNFLKRGVCWLVRQWEKRCYYLTNPTAFIFIRGQSVVNLQQHGWLSTDLLALSTGNSRNWATSVVHLNWIRWIGNRTAIVRNRSLSTSLVHTTWHFLNFIVKETWQCLQLRFFTYRITVRDLRVTNRLIWKVSPRSAMLYE